MNEPPPSPSGLPLLGNTVAFARDPFGYTDCAVETHGDVVDLDVLSTDGPYVLAHPDHAERVLADDRDAFAKTDDFTEAFGQGLVAVEGEEWRRQRETIQPLFYREAIRGYADTMVDCIDHRISTWDDGETRPMATEMKSLTLEVLFATLFGRTLSTTGDDARLRRAAGGLNARFVPTSWALPEWVPTPSRRRFERARETLKSEVGRLMSHHEVEHSEPNTLLSMLAAAHERDGYPETVDAIADQLVTMVFAGHETTALSLTYALALLARNPDDAARVRAEVDTVAGDERLRAVHLDDLEFTEQVIREAMRLYPPVHTIPRRTTRPLEIGGYRIPDGAEVHVSVIQLQRDRRFFEEPLSFHPDRWTEPSWPRFASIPFGAGPRRCIGQQFALVESTLAIAHILRAYELTTTETGPIELAPEMTTQPAGDVPITLRRRR